MTDTEDTPDGTPTASQSNDIVGSGPESAAVSPSTPKMATDTTVASGTHPHSLQDSDGMLITQPPTGLDHSSELPPTSARRPDHVERSVGDSQTRVASRDEVLRDSARDGDSAATESTITGATHPWKIALVATLVTTVLVAGLALFLDERREQAAVRSSQQLAWRLNLSSGAAFPGADLRDLALPGLFAPDVALSGSDLRRTDLTGSWLSGARMDGANLTEAVLEDSRLDGGSFHSSILEMVNLRSASLREVDFRYASMAGADLTNALVDWADFRGVDLTGVNLSGVALRGVCYDDATEWPEGAMPLAPRCKALPSTESGSQATNYQIETLATLETADTSEPRQWLKEIAVTPGQRFSISAEFGNLGWTTLSDVVIKFDLGNAAERYMTVDRVLLYNANHDGDETSHKVTENGIDIGAYTKDSNAFVVVDLVFNPHSDLCGTRAVFTILGFAQPSSFGRVSDGVDVVYDGTPCDP